MTTKILTAAVLTVLLVGSVAFVGPTLAHGDEPTAPVDGATANDTWHGHTGAASQGEWPAWMADHMTQEQVEWMESHLGDDTWYGPADHHTGNGGPNFGDADGTDRYVGTTQQTHRGGYGHGC